MYFIFLLLFCLFESFQGLSGLKLEVLLSQLSAGITSMSHRAWLHGLFFFCVVVLGSKPRALHILGKHSTIEDKPSLFFLNLLF
jgi:hypothetical protein